jgi:transcriptional regulator with XRE-family HTH domain
MMARRPLVLDINPALLEWARTSIGKTSSEVAEQLHIDEKKLQDWERGTQKVNLTEMEKVAKIYKRPLAAFFLPGPPSELAAPADFRTLPVEKRKPLSSKTRLALRRARRLQSLYMELIDRDVNGSSLSVPRVDLSERPDPESVAAQTRDILGISFENQQAWKKETIALAEWRNAIEKQGILVFQMSMHAASVKHTIPPVACAV